MAVRRVCVLLPDSASTARAALMMRVEERTAHTLIGDADDRAIAWFRSERWIVSDYSMSHAARTSAALDERHMAFVITFEGPLTAARRGDLALIRATLVAEGALGSATVRPFDQSSRMLAALPWVRSIRAALEQNEPPSESAHLPSLELDVTVESRHKAATVVEVLREIGATVIGSSHRKVRATLNSAQRARVHKVDGVLAIDAYVRPALCNNHARRLIGIGLEQWNKWVASNNITLDGTGQTVGVADSGVCLAHPALKVARRRHPTLVIGRVESNPSGDDPGWHGTHVSGTIAGSDARVPQKRFAGLAPGVTLVVQALADKDEKLTGLGCDLGELFKEAYTKGVRVHNNSWAADVLGLYTTDAWEVDAFVHDHRDMLIVFAAGNAGTQQPPEFGRKWTERGRVQTGSIGSPATAKNALAVGAQRSKRTVGGHAQRTYEEKWPERFYERPLSKQTLSGDPTQLAGFSSRGPTSDGRCKPDLVAPGTSIASTVSLDAERLVTVEFPFPADGYACASGTSMAAPVVSAAAAITRQYYAEHRAHAAPSAALVKATLINGTDELTGSDACDGDAGFEIPNAHQGFGALNLGRSLAILPAMALAFVDPWRDRDQWLKVGDAVIWQFTVTKKGPLRIAFAYTDAPGPALVHKLVLVLTTPDGRRAGNDRSAQQRAIPDFVNNVQIIRIPHAPKGEYEAKIEFVCGPAGATQDYALVVSGVLASTSLVKMTVK